MFPFVFEYELDMAGVLYVDDEECKNLSYFFNPLGESCMLLYLLIVAVGLLRVFGMSERGNVTD